MRKEVGGWELSETSVCRNRYQHNRILGSESQDANSAD